MGKATKVRQWGQCVYCGCYDTLTVDHVIPRCLFDRGKSGVPSDAPKIRVCRQCNNAKSADDTFLRDVLVRDVRSAEHPVAQNIRHGHHERSIARGMSQYPRAASRLRFVLSPTGSGLLTAEPRLPKGRLRDIFTRLVRGLMFAYEGYELSSETSFDVVRAVNSAWAIAEAQGWAKDTSSMIHPQRIGDGSVFWCVYYHTHAPEQPNRSQWWLCFYERVMFVVWTDMTNLSLGEF